jgi:hypothetical protein
LSINMFVYFRDRNEIISRIYNTMKTGALK